MRTQKTCKTLLFLIALTMLMPAVQLIGTQDASAFGILSSSRKSGKREHKQSDEKKKKSDKSKRSNTTSQAVRSPSTNSRTSTNSRSGRSYRSAPTTTTQRRTVYRTAPSPSTTTRSRTTTRTAPTTTRRRVYTTAPQTTHRHHQPRGRVVHRRHYAPAPRRTVTRTEVHHHHAAPAPRTVTRTEIHHRHTGSPTVVRRRATTQRYYYGSGDTSGGSTVTGTYNRSNRSYAADNGDVTEAYITAGAGVSGFAANQISNDALPGMGFNVGLGAKSGWLAGELGFNMSGYRLDPAQTQSDMALVGVSADLKLQPSFAFLEPYALLGVGGEYFNDSVVNQSATGGALRLGAGLDVRIDNVALSGQYLYTQHGLFGAQGSAYQDNLLTAQTETISVGLKLYF